MKIAILDFETTGLDTKTCEVIEVGLILYDWKENKILKQYDSLIKPTQPVSEEITSITGITNQMLEDHGKHPSIVFGELAQFLYKDKDLFKTDAEPELNYFAAHNGRMFDEVIFRRYIENVSSLEFLKKYLWIDTAHDLPFPPNITCKKLTHLCYEYKYIMTNAHRAIFDCYGVLHLLSEFPCDATINYIQTPNIKIIASVTPPWIDGEKETSLARKWKFQFDRNTKQWYRFVKENDYMQFKIDCPLQIIPEQLELI